MIEPPWNTSIAKQLNLPVSPIFQISLLFYVLWFKIKVLLIVLTCYSTAHVCSDVCIFWIRWRPNFQGFTVYRTLEQHWKYVRVQEINR